MYVTAPAVPRPSEAARRLRVWLHVGDPALARALRAQLLRSGFCQVEPFVRSRAVPGDVIVATPQSLSPAACAELRQRGLRVLLLCPVVRAAERSAYERAGADGVVPMTVEGAELFAALDRIAAAGNEP